MGQNAIDMQNSGTGAEIAARPLVDKNADTKAALPLNGMAALPLRMGIPEIAARPLVDKNTNKPSGIAAAVAAGKNQIAARPLSNLQKLDALFHLSQISDSL